MPTRSSYRLTPDLVAAHAGEQILCLAAAGIGRRWDLYAERPGAHLAALDVAVLSPMADLIGGAEASEPPPVLRVDIRGPIDSHAGYVEGPAPCSGGYVDGNDAISERLVAAFTSGDVLLCVDSPGGNPAGAPEGIRRALEAKRANGRRCVLHCEGTMGSLALWWGFAIADEVYISIDARIGSIGARGGTKSIAGALAMAGETVTFSAWPDEGKLANVPELPTSATAKARNDRDVRVIGEAFAAAVATSQVGLRNGLTVETIRALPGSIGGADVLTGYAARAAGLCDDVATLEETAAWALASAGTGETGDIMTIKADGGGPPKPDDDDAPESTKAPPGLTPQTACASCKMENRPESKFCDQCGASMAALPVDDAPPESKPAPKPAATAARAPSPASALASVPALRSALASRDGILDRVAKMVGATTHAEIVGSVEAVCSDAGKAARYRNERNAARASADAKERIDTLLTLAARDPAGHPRGKLVVDIVENIDAAGRVIPVSDTTTRAASSRVVGVKPAPLWSDGPEGRTMANLRGYARTTLAGLGTNASEASPFDRPPAQPSERAAADQPMEAEIARAMTDPVVILAARTTPGAKIEDIARSHVLAERAARRVQVPA